MIVLGACKAFQFQFQFGPPLQAPGPVDVAHQVAQGFTQSFMGEDGTQVSISVVPATMYEEMQHLWGTNMLPGEPVVLQLTAEGVQPLQR